MTEMAGQLHFYLDADQAAAFREACGEAHMNMSSVMRAMVREWLAKRQKAAAAAKAAHQVQARGARRSGRKAA